MEYLPMRLKTDNLTWYYYMMPTWQNLLCVIDGKQFFYNFYEDIFLKKYYPLKECCCIQVQINLAAPRKVDWFMWHVTWWNWITECDEHFSGDVVLKDLRLKDSALQDLDLPIKTVSGYLGRYFFSLLFRMWNGVGYPISPSKYQLF